MSSTQFLPLSLSSSSSPALPIAFALAVSRAMHASIVHAQSAHVDIRMATMLPALLSKSNHLSSCSIVSKHTRRYEYAFHLDRLASWRTQECSAYLQRDPFFLLVDMNADKTFTDLPLGTQVRLPLLLFQTQRQSWAHRCYIPLVHYMLVKVDTTMSFAYLFFSTYKAV